MADELPTEPTIDKKIRKQAKHSRRRSTEAAPTVATADDLPNPDSNASGADSNASASLNPSSNAEGADSNASAKNPNSKALGADSKASVKINPTSNARGADSKASAKGSSDSKASEAADSKVKPPGKRKQEELPEKNPEVSDSFSSAEDTDDDAFDGESGSNAPGKRLSTGIAQKAGNVAKTKPKGKGTIFQKFFIPYFRPGEDNPLRYIQPLSPEQIESIAQQTFEEPFIADESPSLNK
jgi:hypothetical protein